MTEIKWKQIKNMLRKGWPNFNYKSVHTYVCKCRRLGPRMSASQPFSARICPHRLIIVSLKFGISFHDWNSMSKVLCATREVCLLLSSSQREVISNFQGKESLFLMFSKCWEAANASRICLELYAAKIWILVVRKWILNFELRKKKLRGINELVWKN